MQKVMRNVGIYAEHGFASAWHPRGTQLCVTSRNNPDRRLCGVVVDVCHPDHCAAQKNRGLAVEVSFEDAQYLFGLKTVGGLSEKECPVIVEVL